MSEMNTIVRNTCRAGSDAPSNLHTFTLDTNTNEKQRHALELINGISL